jgi:hypothetical protein
MNPDGDVSHCCFAPRSCARLQDHHLPIGTEYPNRQRIWSPICCCALVQLQYSDIDVHEQDGIEGSQQVLTRPLNRIMATSRDRYLAIKAKARSFQFVKYRRYFPWCTELTY